MGKVSYHVGLHKTATTYLQNEYFPQLPVEFVKGAHSFTDTCRILGGGSSCLISDENLSGRLFSVGGGKMEEFRLTIAAIKRMHPDAGIVIGFRKHCDYLLSAYKQHLHQGGTLSQSEFFNANNTGLLRSEDLHFREYIDLVKEQFDDVFVYTIDDVKYMDVFHRDISIFLGLKCAPPIFKNKSANRGVKSRFQVGFLLHLNRLNEFIKRFLRVNLLYGRLFKYLRITPRHLCQKYLPDAGKAYCLDQRLKAHVDEMFKEDWAYVLQNKSIKEPRKKGNR